MLSSRPCGAQSRHAAAIQSEISTKFNVASLRMTPRFISVLGAVIVAAHVGAQSAVDVVRPEEQQRARRAVVKEQEKRAKRSSTIEFRGQQAFKDKELRV